MKNLAIIQILFLRTGNSINRLLKICSVPLISIFLLICSCTPAHYSSLKKTGYDSINLEKFVPVGFKNKKILFKAGIDIYGQHLSGLMFIKYFGERHYRTVFITEVGMSIFDFEFNHGIFKDNGSLDFIKKTYILETLKKDLMLILMEDYISPEAVLFVDSETANRVYRMNCVDGYNYFFIDKTGNLVKIENSSELFKKIRIEYIYNANKSISKIKVSHYNLDLMMDFNTVEKITDYD